MVANPSIVEINFCPWGIAESDPINGRLALDASLIIFLLDTVAGHLFVVFLKRYEVFSSLGELALFHTLTNVPMNKRSLRVHEIELVVQSALSLGDGSRFREHTDRVINLGQFTTGNGQS